MLADERCDDHVVRRHRLATPVCLDARNRQLRVSPRRRLRTTAGTVASRRKTRALPINDTAPNFEAETTEGKIRFHDWIGDNWAVLFAHPKDFTPICTTELGYMKIKSEFDKRGVKIIGISVDPV